jgi:ATP-binding cassette subfamily F protein uup
MAQLNLKQISLGYGHPLLLDKLQLAVEKGERICLVGRNGAGKSSLLKIIAGSILPDSGERWIESGLTLTYLDQDTQPIEQSVFDLMLASFGQRGQVVKSYLDQLQNNPMSDLLGELQMQMDQEQNWSIESQIYKWLDIFSISPEWNFNLLSGGVKRRVLLAAVLAQESDIILLDEPTNHLDIRQILMLEKKLLDLGKTLIFVTHDRSFLQKMATSIMELDRGRLSMYDCDYENYLIRKQAMLEAEDAEFRRQDQKLSEEEAWLRQGVKARRTRNQGRLRALLDLREERKQRQTQLGKSQIKLNQAEFLAKKVFEFKSVSLQFDDKVIIKNFSAQVLRNDKIALLGPNGSGKTSLIQLMLKQIEPTIGSLQAAEGLQVAYFDQLKAKLDPLMTLRDFIGEGSDRIDTQGKSQHVVGYLQNFLFTPDRINSPISVLSGGERNRLLMAKIFAKPSQIMILDEPTNDLDVETLEILESLLVDYTGTLIFVSHDRTFVDNVATHVWVLDGSGDVDTRIGGYSDVQALFETKAIDTEKQKKVTTKSIGSVDDRVAKKEEKTIEKLTHDEKKRLAALPKLIQTLETKINQQQEVMCAPEFYDQPNEKRVIAQKELQAHQKELELAYQEWELLESKSSASQ